MAEDVADSIYYFRFNEITWNGIEFVWGDKWEGWAVADTGSYSAPFWEYGAGKAGGIDGLYEIIGQQDFTVDLSQAGYTQHQDGFVYVTSFWDTEKGNVTPYTSQNTAPNTSPNGDQFLGSESGLVYTGTNWLGQL